MDRRPHIAVVEDKATQRQLPVEYLDKQNFRMSGADGGEETLTASEYDFLEVLAENPNRPLRRDWLLELTAQREMEAFDRAVDLRIARLRRKVKVYPAHPDSIRIVRSVGYVVVSQGLDLTARGMTAIVTPPVDGAYLITSMIIVSREVWT